MIVPSLTDQHPIVGIGQIFRGHPEIERMFRQDIQREGRRKGGAPVLSISRSCLPIIEMCPIGKSQSLPEDHKNRSARWFFERRLFGRFEIASMAELLWHM